MSGILIILVAHGSAAVEAGERALFVRVVLVHGAVYGLAVWWTLARPHATSGFWAILLIAVVLRWLSLTAPIGLSTDVYRYIWDGRLMWEGISPYLFVPADQSLSHLRDETVYPLVNQKERAVTIYPPMAQIVFAAGVWLSDSVDGQRAVMLLGEVVVVVALLGWLRALRLPPSRILIYAWHPLPIWELASQAHFDAAAMAFLALAIWAAVSGRQGWAGAALAAAALVKLLPIAFLPALWRRGDRRLPLAFGATALLLYAPHLTTSGTGVLGYLGRHLDNEGYVAGWGVHVVWLLRDFHLADPPGWVYAVCAAAVLGVAGLWALLARRADEVRWDGLLLIAVLVVALPSPHYPWYFALLTLFIVVRPHPAVIALSILSVCLYLPRHPEGLTWTHVYGMVYGIPLIVLAAMELWRRRPSGRGWLRRAAPPQPSSAA